MQNAALILALAAGAWAQAPQPQEQKAPQEQKPPPSAAAGGTASTLLREDPAEARRLFRQLDRNGDGYLTGDELRNALRQDTNWAAVDRDRDGRIAPSEFTVLQK
jgi:Ca2+-binding EF-hand superfamily protein